jgi:hypothetical protein
VPASLQPPGASTQYRHPRCFAAADANCSTKISREHFISESLLRQFELNDTAKIAGLRWQQAEAFNILPIRGLASNILCDRHNSALSPLDDVAGRFSQTIADYDRALLAPEADPQVERREFDGEDIERWMLKCIIGMVVSRNIGASLKPGCIELLFANTHWPDGWGLHWLHVGGPTYHSSSIAIETMLHPVMRTILLAKFIVRGMPFGLCLGKPDHPEAFGVRRPAAIVFRAGADQREIILDWQQRPTGPPILLDRAGTYDGSPPNWKDWERSG